MSRDSTMIDATINILNGSDKIMIAKATKRSNKYLMRKGILGLYLYSMRSRVFDQNHLKWVYVEDVLIDESIRFSLQSGKKELV